MPTAVAISVEEYLRTTYRPDCDYVDGEVVERNWRETDHSRLQGMMIFYLIGREKLWGITVLPEQRVQVKGTRFRAGCYRSPGTVARNTDSARPPLLCVEILSPEDRMERVQGRIEEYLEFGLTCLWLLNPRTRQGYVYTNDGMREAKDGILRVSGTPIEVPIAELR